VLRTADHQPLANYRVRYRVLDGPSAFLLPTREKEAVAVTDQSGRAAISLGQPTAAPGTSRVSIEVIRPGDPASGGGDVVVGRGETTVEWQAAQLSLSVALPQVADPGQDIPLSLTVANAGQVATQPLTLRQPLPTGMKLIGSDPPAVIDRGYLVWQLPALPGGGQHKVTAMLRADGMGTVSTSAYVFTADGLRAEAQASTRVAAGQLQVEVKGPAQVLVNDAVEHEVALTNPGGAAVANATLLAQFDAGLEHETKANPLQLPLGPVGPGETRTVKLVLQAKQPGTMNVQVTAQGDGGFSARADHAVTVRQPRLTLQVSGPASRAPNVPTRRPIRGATGGT
jgi:uncharacterized repeat protein (TIGR01451 family)